jgi:hypothetical protein
MIYPKINQQYRSEVAPNIEKRLDNFLREVDSSIHYVKWLRQKQEFKNNNTQNN